MSDVRLGTCSLEMHNELVSVRVVQARLSIFVEKKKKEMDRCSWQKSIIT